MVGTSIVSPYLGYGTIEKVSNFEIAVAKLKEILQNVKFATLCRSVALSEAVSEEINELAFRKEKARCRWMIGFKKKIMRV